MKNEHPNIILHLSGLADGDYAFDYEVDEGVLDLPDSFREKIRVHVDLNRLRSQFVVKCAVATTSVHPCDRCLEPVRLSHDEGFTIIYTYGPGGADAQLDEDEVRTLDPSDPKIDLTGDVRETLMLGVPMRITCGDEPGKTECTNPYMAEHEAAKDAVDPRWEVLKKKSMTAE